MFLDADANLVDKVNNENMKKLSLEERSKLQTLAKRPMKQLKLELEASRLVEAETDCEIKVVSKRTVGANVLKTGSNCSLMWAHSL